MIPNQNYATITNSDNTRKNVISNLPIKCHLVDQYEPSGFLPQMCIASRFAWIEALRRAKQKICVTTLKKKKNELTPELLGKIA